MISRESVLSRLPAYRDEWVLINANQYVKDIMREIGETHTLYKGLYDQFSYLFYTTDPITITESLYRFCKNNIRYSEESVNFQSSAVPQGILTRSKGDCKHYAIFNAGVISSLNRCYGCCFDASFMFVGYRRAAEPYHVFVRVGNGDYDVWLDPTPGSGSVPTLVIEKPL